MVYWVAACDARRGIVRCEWCAARGSMGSVRLLPWSRLHGWYFVAEATKFKTFAAEMNRKLDYLFHLQRVLELRSFR